MEQVFFSLNVSASCYLFPKLLRDYSYVNIASYSVWGVVPKIIQLGQYCCCVGGFINSGSCDGAGKSIGK